MFFGKYINKYYLKYWLFFLFGVIALVAVDIVQLYIPEALGRIVDIFNETSVISEAQQKEVLNIVMCVIGVAFVMLIGRIAWRFTIFNASHKIEADLRHKMFLKCEELSVSYYKTTKTGTIMSWLTSDIDNLTEFFGWGTIMLVDAVFLGILAFYKMFTTSLLLSCLLYIPVILLVIWSALVEKFMVAKWNTRQEAFDRLYDFADESFAGIRVIKAFVNETKELHAFAKIAKQNEDTNISFVRLSVVCDVLIQIIIAVIMSLLIGIGGYVVYQTLNNSTIFGIEANLTAGKLVEFTGYFDTVVWPMIALGQIITMYARSKASAKRITRFLEQPIDIKDKQTAINLDNIKGKIEFNNLSFAFDDDTNPYLKNISLTIKKGESVGIIGKVGCGKTTLMNLLMRLYNVKDGSIKIDGVDINDIKLECLRNNIAYVPQDNFLFSAKIKDNIGFSNENATDEEIKEAARFSDIENDILAFKGKYETVVGERGVTLSGGQKQRVSIARAYLKKAPIMILDDSVSAVDTKTEDSIIKHIFEKRKDQTTIIIASRISTVMNLDKIIVLNNGELEAFGDPSSLLKTSETYKKMYYLQQLESELKGGK